jgi:hypothetical protein
VRLSLVSSVFVFLGKILTKERIVRCFLATRGHFAAERPWRSAAHLTGRPGPLYRVAGWLLHLHGRFWCRRVLVARFILLKHPPPIARLPPTGKCRFL